MNKQQLAATIWRGANKLRGKIEAAEYKNYILGFIFYKFLSDKEEKFLRDRHWEDEDFLELTDDAVQHKKLCQDNIGYYIVHDNLFSHWIAEGKDFDAGQVTTALNAFERNINQNPDAGFKPIYENIFKTLRNNLSGLGSNNLEVTKAVIDIITLVQKIPMDDKQDYDVLGFIYEYLIGMFAANAGKKAGEFYTPHEVSVLMSEIIADHLRGREQISIYDPTSGSASLLINIGKSVSKYLPNENGVKYYAQELIEATYNITRMNLVMRGILPSNIEAKRGDSLADDWPLVKKEENGVEKFDPLWLDAVVSNPPYSQAWTPHDDPRFDEFGLAPRGKADYAFLLHDLYHIKDDGIMTIVLPHGVLFRGNFNKEDPDNSQDECKIRYNLVEKNYIDAIIGLPANIFFGTGIPTIIMVLKKRKTTDDILFVDASKGFIKNGKKNKLRKRDIRRIVDIVIHRQEIKHCSRKVPRQEIRDNEYSLILPKYIDSGEKPENWDVYSVMEGGIPKYELEDLNDYWNVFSGLYGELFVDKNDSFVLPREADSKKIILNNSSVKNFIKNYKESFNGFDSYLKEKLLSDPEKLNVVNTESEITSKIFDIVKDIPLVDEYSAYQLFSDVWDTISVDLEMITSEGFMSACTQVDQKMVPNKKDKDAEDVPDGYVGHVLPFELVQKYCLSEKYNKIKDIENELLEIADSYSEILENMSDEEKESELITEEKDGFVNKLVSAKAKEIIKSKISYEDDSFEKKILDVSKLIDREKVLKKDLKSLSTEIEDETKTTIEKLQKDTIINLLIQKWITPLIDNLGTLPKIIIDDFAKKVSYFYKKYDLTLFDVETNIKNTEKELIGLISDLNADGYNKQGLSDLLKFLGVEKKEK